MRLCMGMKFAAVLAVAALPATGCNSSPGGPGETTPAAAPTSTLTPLGLEPEAPAGYNPCEAVTQDILDRLELRAATNPNTADLDGPGGLKWRGCEWVRSREFAVGVTVTNVTLDYARKTWTTDLQEFALGGRNALSMRKSDEHPDDVCTLNVEIAGGSLEFHVVKSSSSQASQQLDPCQAAREVAEQVVPTLPPSA
ncbi:DUF3558 domain-containing protein [Nocardia carnea]|uniref:DUF3558 domain-containing protein n=1 Tax=Nocardia carnea TaxID=37328 RepID=UPI00245800F2|nr:DUF3558 domain-containing protein [Nocardia carnea]